VSIVAHCGGGGSAATGVKNTITVVTSAPPDSPGGVAAGELVISTGDQVGVAITVVKNPITNKLRLFVGLGHKVHVYDLQNGGEMVEQVSVGENVNCITVNSLTSRLAVGCDGGAVKIFAIDNSKDQFESELPVMTLEGHTKAVSAVYYAPRGEDKLVSSGKDGTARVWQGEDCLGVLQCSIEDPKAPKPKRPQQVLVRGCAFGDLMGDLVYTVASGRKGKAFLSKWIASKDGYQCEVRTACSPFPVSAMNLSGDAGMMALGAVDGTIILWGIEKWKPQKKFFEVHDLPVTCIAARPYPVPLMCDEDNDGDQMHALSASADSQLAWLSLQRRSKSTKNRPPSDVNFKTVLHALLKMAAVGWMLHPFVNEIKDKCDMSLGGGLAPTWECIRHEVLLAPTSRPGIAVPPH
jgi:WD40 repeat protein